MNLDAMIEDLEAQGYFNSKQEKYLNSRKLAKLVRVSFRDKSRPDLFLQSPIQGTDFVGGFVGQDWYLSNSSSVLRIDLPSADSCLQEVNSSWFDIVKGHLVGAELTICLNSEGDLSGALLEIQNDFVSLATAENVHVYSKFAICMLIVENVSGIV